MGLIVVDWIPSGRLRWLFLLCCLRLLAVEGLGVVLDPVTAVGHHLGRGCGCASQTPCRAVTRWTSWCGAKALSPRRQATASLLGVPHWGVRQVDGKGQKRGDSMEGP